MSQVQNVAPTELVDDDAAPFFAPVATDAIDRLLGEHGLRQRQIAFAAKAFGELSVVLPYFFNQDQDRYGRTYIPPSTEAYALAGLSADFWDRALRLTDVLDYMPQKRREEWFKDIREKTTPPFSEETVRATLRNMLALRSQFLAERVDGIFQALSGEHVTNAPEGFGRRMILNYIADSAGYVNHGRAGVVNDLRCVVAKFMGRDEPKWGATSALFEVLKRSYGEWVTVDGGAMRIRLYKKGTAHIEVHQDIAWRLNQVLAHLHPLAIPSEFRKKPKKPPKDFALVSRPLPFAVVELLARMKPYSKAVAGGGPLSLRHERVPNSLAFEYSTGVGALRKDVDEVMAAIGGVNVRNLYYQFDYDPTEVRDYIVTSGCIPDQKRHQFYATREELALRAIDLADLGTDCTILEPSAGQGGLADHMPKDWLTCVEVAPLHCEILKAKGHDVKCADFLTWGDGLEFDRVVMNPPFSEGRWKAHVEHAYELLAPGGTLVAIVPGSAKSQIEADEWKGPYADEFAGTSVSVLIMKRKKPRA